MQLFSWQQLPLLILIQVLDPLRLSHVLQVEALLTFYSLCGCDSSQLGGIIKRYPCVGHRKCVYSRKVNDASNTYWSAKYIPSLQKPDFSQSQQNLLRSRKLKAATRVVRYDNNVPTLTPWQTTTDNKKPNKQKLAAIIGGAGAAFLVVVITLLVYFCLRRLKSVVRRASDTTSSVPSPPAIWGRGNNFSSANVVSPYEARNLRSLQLSELEQATGNFNESNIIGEGSFGLVYKGLLNDGSIVAMKRRQYQPIPNFINQVKRIASVHHRHLVKLIGYCDQSHQQILIYDYLPNGNVANHLYDSEGLPIGKLEMRQRLLIALGAAKGCGKGTLSFTRGATLPVLKRLIVKLKLRSFGSFLSNGLEHLHSLVPPMFHMHFRTKNVLMDADFVAKVSDSGLANLLAEGYRTESSSSIDCFRDPMLRSSNEFSDKSDIYSYGVFLLELISGREAFGQYQLELEEKLTLQAKNANSIENFIDKSAKDHSIHAVKEMLELALLCVNNNLTSRPTMKGLVEELEHIQNRESRHIHSGRGEDIGVVTLGSELFK